MNELKFNTNKKLNPFKQDIPDFDSHDYANIFALYKYF